MSTLSKAPLMFTRSQQCNGDRSIQLAVDLCRTLLLTSKRLLTSSSPVTEKKHRYQTKKALTYS
jgi:hypothetical protein